MTTPSPHTPDSSSPPSSSAPAASLPALLRELDDLRHQAGRLEGLAESLVRDHHAARRELLAVEEFLALSPLAQERLEDLSRDLFGELMEEVESNLTHAVREILGQDRKVVSRREVKSGKFFITLEIENQGQVEDILQGQGGSVCNILSVGLRLIGLAQLDPALHRPFLVLDEQDCWLRPELVPRFNALIAAIGEKLGLQVLTISHHSVDSFSGSAGRVFQLAPSREAGVTVTVLEGLRKAGALTGEDEEAQSDE
ncbi:MAG: hypothetical protein ACLGSA_14905 [Acidobacteriota bacterium]